MRQLKSIAELRALGKQRRKAKKTTLKKGPRVDYGRRVRNVHDGVGLCVRPVLPHTGPKPHSYPKLEWTPLSWRIA